MAESAEAMAKFDLAVYGGGAIGWSVAFHVLHREPGTSVCVVDPDPSRASSSRGAGGFRTQFSDPFEIEMSLLSLAEYSRFEEVVGESVGFEKNGYLLIAGEERSAEALEAAVALQCSYGASNRVLTAAEVHSRAPLWRAPVTAGAWGPDDGYLDGPAVRASYRAAALRRGATESLEPLEARTRAYCAAHWTAHLWPHGGVAIAEEPHQLLIAPGREPVLLDAPMIVDLETTFHFRPDGEGLIIGYDDPELDCPKAPDGTALPDLGMAVRLAGVAGTRCPAVIPHILAATPRCGWYAETPDGKPYIDRVGDDVIVAGFGGHGVMHAPAAGVLAAELVLDGEARSLDTSLCRVGRELVPSPPGMKI
jgi:sarcosine oxidase subunit beta